MPIDRNKILVDSVKRLLRRGAISHLAKIVNKTHGADLSVLFRSLALDQQRKLFDMITDVEQKGILFSELEEDIFKDLIEDLFHRYGDSRIELSGRGVFAMCNPIEEIC